MTVAAQAFIQLDQREDARRALERALELEPNQPLAARLLAAIRIAAGDTDRGLADLAVAARLAPEDSRPWRAMGKVYFTRMQYDQSIHAYQEALKRNPRDAQARLDYLTVLLDQNLGETAAPYLAEALRDTPNDPHVLGLAARQAYAAGRRDDAVKLAERALDRDPENFDALIALGRVELAEGRWKSSMEHAQRAVAAQPNDVGALHLLAQAHFRLGQNELGAAAADRRDRVQSRRDSIAKLAMMIAYRPDDPKLHLLMGQLAVEAGLNVLAEQSYRAALAIDPRCRPAMAGLARLRSEPRDRVSEVDHSSLERGRPRGSERYRRRPRRPAGCRRD